MSLLVISVNHHLIDYLSKLCDSSCYHPQVDVVAWADISIDTQWGNEYSLILTGVDEVISWMEQETLPPLLSNGLLVVLGDFSLLADAQRRDIENLISKYKITEVLLALPSVSRVRRNEIINLLEPYPVMVRSLPGVSELAQGKINISDLKEVSIKDLLGRDAVKPNKELLSQNNTRAKIYGREKTPFSIWRKVQKKRVSLEQITDIIGFRLILETVDDWLAPDEEVPA